MREIKFRGKAINKELCGNDFWIGDLITCKNRCWIKPKSNMPSSKHQFSGLVAIREVDSNTVNQYTGFKDIDGVEIYESDIVEMESYTIGVDDFLGTVVFMEGAFMVDNGKDAESLMTECHYYKVVGNVYEK